jgi:hypothetical protein
VASVVIGRALAERRFSIRDAQQAARGVGAAEDAAERRR